MELTNLTVIPISKCIFRNHSPIISTICKSEFPISCICSHISPIYEIRLKIVTISRTKLDNITTPICTSCINLSSTPLKINISYCKFSTVLWYHQFYIILWSRCIYSCQLNSTIYSRSSSCSFETYIFIILRIKRKYSKCSNTCSIRPILSITNIIIQSYQYPHFCSFY